VEHGRRESAVLTIRTVAETGSTNADMLVAAAAGAAEGSWLRTERQTAGRGRQGRPWRSERGNLAASTIVRLRAADPPAPTLGLVVAVALDEALRGHEPSLRYTIKWPNDVLIDGAKLSGILLERADDAVVIGVGVNLAYHPHLADRATTSLAEHGATVDPAAFLETLAEALARWVARWRSEGLPPVRSRWLERAHPVGTALSVRHPDGGTVEGLFDGLAADGALLLRLASGERRAMHAGDVFLI